MESESQTPTAQDFSRCPVVFLVDDYVLSLGADDPIIRTVMQHNSWRRRQYPQTRNTALLPRCDLPECRGFVLTSRHTNWEAETHLAETLTNTMSRELSQITSPSGVIDKSSIILSKHGRSARDDPNTWDPIPTLDRTIDSCRSLVQLAFESPLRPDRLAADFADYRHVRESHLAVSDLKSFDERLYSQLLSKAWMLRQRLLSQVGNRSRFVTRTEAFRGWTSAPPFDQVVSVNR